MDSKDASVPGEPSCMEDTYNDLGRKTTGDEEGYYRMESGNEDSKYLSDPAPRLESHVSAPTSTIDALRLLAKEGRDSSAIEPEHPARVMSPFSNDMEYRDHTDTSWLRRRKSKPSLSGNGVDRVLPGDLASPKKVSEDKASKLSGLFNLLHGNKPKEGQPQLPRPSVRQAGLPYTWAPDADVDESSDDEEILSVRALISQIDQVLNVTYI